jgi:hypothetical protein
MSIVLEEGKSMAIWLAALPNDFKYDKDHVGGDVLFHLGYEDETKKTLVLTYRFRYHTIHRHGDPFAEASGPDGPDKDIKNWFTGKMDATQILRSLCTRHNT